MEEFQEEDFEEKYQEDEKEYQEDEEVSLYEGPQALQEEEYNEAVEEIYAQTQDKEIQESDNQGVQLNDVYFEDDEDYSLWNEEQTYAPITLEDIEDVDGDESNSFEYAEDTRTPSEKSEDNYVNVFYRSNEYDPYDNMSFKERISENAPTVDSLEAELDDILQDDFNLEEFAEAESMPLMLEEDEIVSNTEDVASLHEEAANKEFFADTSEIDRSDIALLLEFGYEEEVLRNVPQEKIEGFSDDELIDDILQENKEEIDFLIANSTVIAYGMGTSENEDGINIVRHLLKNFSGTLILDAGGLRCLAKIKKEEINQRACALVLTPHLGEMKALYKEFSEPLDVIKYAEEIKAVVLLKGNTSIITNGKEALVTNTGCPGMAKGGSGDVLSGIVAGFCATRNEKTKLLSTVALSAYINGAAGQEAQNELCDISMSAYDTALNVAKAIAKTKK